MSDYLYLNLSERPRILWGGRDLYNTGLPGAFRLRDIWCLHYYTYAAQLRHNDRVEQIYPGCIGVCEPYAEVEYSGLRGAASAHYAFNFQLPEASEGFCWRVPLMVPAEAHKMKDAQQRMEMATELCLPLRKGETKPLKAEVELWSILLSIAEPTDFQGKHSSVELAGRTRMAKAFRMIDSSLGKELYPEMIADELGVSVTHLGRLFKQYAGCPVATYIRRQRVKHARTQLVFSNKPIRDIADEIGIHDLANFNRMIRREFGRTPREVREQNKEGFIVADRLD
ncbi:AraC family transcriptional regulator [Coraliomargarita akajimensis]|uniref:Transcriptional regulator, AraC family n=1 Tax=Coraliomargarita akajimensis (strain DSM 45221 / IAM 15411 / JCM 23193 / KCTC 12865 / 04OKA010-24) TaxID=583355 RepID=D5EMK2_CORAD|nr:AraC family transcriptional regulator [Coraliomargarita akajimensis]ADE53408.1 transcriptional regulator, AraC family [Coraliomargarita akajimensis DSM 45221]